jgi:hypothetical protein
MPEIQYLRAKMQNLNIRIHINFNFKFKYLGLTAAPPQPRIQS